MAENVILSVQLNGAEAAISQLTQLDNVLKSIKANHNVKINVNARSLINASEASLNLAAGLDHVKEHAKSIGTVGAKSINTAGTSLKNASRNAESFRLGMGSVVSSMLKFRLVSGAINLAINAFKGAFTEMKAVDTEMVNIRKVTGFTTDEIEKLSKSAYNLATNYGRSASEVLTASTVFARAGYTDQIEQLSELSLLLQNVGDLNAENASKFLIATDKAYKLGGSYNDLMTVIDGLDKITNKNATDMQKMTEGMTVAGSVFAESGESIEVFAALLGTATADTQRSGSEVARGLRTILMNLRQIRGETEDGELIDGESIANASKALKDYAKISTMENGQLRKASDVLEELAGKWDTLNEVQQSAIAEAVAGKRQANVLMTLMGDWESVQKMIGEYETGAGTAAKENAIYMESWAAKTAQVKASWNELISSLVSSDSVKRILDDVSKLIGVLTKFSQSAMFRTIVEIVSEVAQFGFDAIESLIDASDSLFASQEKQIDKTREKIKSLNDEVGKTRDQYDEQFGDSTRYAYLLANLDRLTDSEKTELAILESQRLELEKIIQLRERELAVEEQKLKKQQQAQLDARDNAAKGNLQDIGSSLRVFNEEFLDTGDVEAYRNAILDLLGDYQSTYLQLQELKAAGKDLTDQEQRFFDVYELTSRSIIDGGNAADVYAQNAALAFYAFGSSAEESADRANGEVQALSESLQELPEIKTISIQVNTSISGSAAAMISEMGSITAGLPIPHHAGGTRGAVGGPALVNENGPELISANGLAWIAGGGKPTVTMLPRGATVLTAQQTRTATHGASIGPLPAFKDGWVDASFFEKKEGDGQDDSAYWAAHPGLYEQYKRAREEGRKRATVKDKIYDPLPGGGSYSEGSSVPSAPDFKALEDELSKVLKNLDAQAKLAENEEDYVKAMMVYGKAQTAIADLLEQYRVNGYAEDSDEVLKLANLGYDYAAKQLGGYDKLQQNLIDALNALTQSTDKANDLAERREAVDKAREALANAERQRTVRVFNPVTGQWEWVANAADIAKAQESLKNAEESLRKEELSQAVDAIKNAKAEELGDMTLSPAVMEALLGGSPEQQTAFLNALGAATGGADWLSSSEAQSAWNQGNNIGTQYNLNGITLTEAQASGMTIKELISMLQGLKIM